MDRTFQRRIATSLGYIRASHEELQKPAFWNYERMVVRKNLINLIERCTALLAELNENELKEQREILLEQQEEERELRQEEEARRRLDPYTDTEFVDPDDKPLLTVLLLIVLPIFLLGFIYLWLFLTQAKY